MNPVPASVPALEFRGLVKRHPGFTLGPLDLTVPRGASTGSSARTARARAPPST